MAPSIGAAVPIIRIFDVDAAKRFYVDYLGCTLDWEDGSDDGPVYMQVSLGDMVLHLSSNHDDGTPGSAVLIETEDVSSLHAELHARDYPFLNPGIEPGPAGGREMQLIDPFSNRLRFFQRSR
jgi:ribosomal-protein-alanine N-acetyltransferase